MKNRRAIGVLAIVSLAAALAVGLALRWYLSGGVPAGPASYLDEAELRRALARLESFRIELPEAEELCRRVLALNRRAEDVRFTNPAGAEAALRQLEAEAVDIARSERLLVRDLDAGNPGTWQPGFEAWADQATTAFREGGALCRLLLRSDPREVSFPALSDQVIRGKDLTARALAFPLWADDPALRATWYPAFEQAYADRAETSPARLRASLLRAPAPVLRWYYARLYQDQASLPAPACAAALRRQAAEMDQLLDDLAYADARDTLQGWAFPGGRAAGCRWLAARMDGIEQAPTLAAWRERANAAFPAPAEEAPRSDPEVRLAAERLHDAAGRLGLRFQALVDDPGRSTLQDLLDPLRRAADDDPDILACSGALFRDVSREIEQTLDAVDRIAEAGELMPEPALARFEALVRQTGRLNALLGADVSDALVDDAFNRWLESYWPEVPELGGMAAILRGLNDRGILPLPSKIGVDHLLDELAGTTAPARRARLQEEWSRAIRPRLEALPALRRRIDHSLGDLRQVIAEEEFRNLLRFGSRLQIESASRRILVDPETASWTRLRADAEAVLQILALPLALQDLELRDPGRLAETNPRLLPAPPDAEAPHAGLYRETVAPLTAYGRAIAAVRTAGAAGACAGAVLGAWGRREDVVARFPDWAGLDRRLADILCELGPCLPAEADAADRTAAVFRELSAVPAMDPQRRTCLARRASALAAWKALRVADPEAEPYLDTLETCRSALDQAGWLMPDLAARLETRAEESAFLQALARQPNSFFRLRQQVDAFARVHVGDLARTHRAAVNRLEPLVRADIGLVRDDGGTADVRELAAAYRAFADDAALPGRYRRYAAGQVDTLDRYLADADYRLRPVLSKGAAKQGVLVPFHRFGPDMNGLGHGLRTPGRGTGLELLVKSGPHAALLLSADWADDPDARAVRLSRIRAREATFAWSWGTPMEFVIRVRHTLDARREMIPGKDSGRNWWNPMDYGVFRVELRAYPIRTYSSIESFARNHLAGPSTDDAILLLLDDLLNPGALPSAEDALAYQLTGIPPGRDLDWPISLTPPTTDPSFGLDALESVISNAVEELLNLSPAPDP